MEFKFPLEYDPLGSVLVELDQAAEASRAIRTARRLVPAFTQGGEHLDRLLAQVGRTHSLRLRRLD